MQRATFRVSSLIRASIVTSLLGHGVANALFDADEYRGAGSAVLDRLDDPFLVQAGVGLLFLAVLSGRRALGRGILISTPRVLAGLSLVVIQLALFIGLEGSERWAVELLAPREADVGIFGAGFVAELLVAVGSALLLVLIGEVTRSLLQPLGAGEPPATARIASHPVGFRPSVRVLSGAGGVRAPPR